METGLHRKEVNIDEQEAGSLIEDGMTIAIGDFITSSHPMAIIRHVIQKEGQESDGYRGCLGRLGS